ncbi:hypothetical protein POM88_021692 [Heracleum sosnowskyi]|uniref:Uncharacterized protein n=1 Tax=Heracleum sosnowskyi TaxID=360622 RepID=A0AAD8MT12_9APIA|nr:hypothetical protein POM88_021692 [Heracleum sosnowskyi]
MGQYIARKTDDRGTGSGKGKNVVNVVLGGSNSPPRSPDSGDEIMMVQTCPEQIISFNKDDFEGLDPNHNEALVVSLDIADNEVKRILIDNGSSVNIIFKHIVDRMQLGSVKMNDCREDPLYDFGNNLVPIQGTLYLPVLFGTYPNQVTNIVKFYVINTPSSYNVILGRPALTKLQAITSTPHLKFKFPTPSGIGEVRGDYEMASRCYRQGAIGIQRSQGPQQYADQESGSESSHETGLKKQYAIKSKS